jgi:hypothetical protein
MHRVYISWTFIVNIYYAALVNTTHGFIGDGMFYMPNGMVILRRM